MDYKNNQLIISCSNDDFILPEKFNHSLLYSVGSGKPINANCRNLNNSKRLNKIAEDIRDDYCDWIYQCNSLFLSNKLIHRNEFSLFFLTDFSCKRTEYFNTFNTICNIKEILEQVGVDTIKKIVFVSADIEFIAAIKKIFKFSSFEILNKKERTFISLKSFVTNHLFFIKALVVSLLNIFLKAPKGKKYKNLYFTRYPLHFIDDDGGEDKYGRIDKSSDNFAISILTDDYHQKVSILEYMKYKKEVESFDYSLIDSYLKFKDVFTAYINSIISIKKWRSVVSNNFIFHGIDISGYCQNELNFSYNRVTRLLMWENVLRRYLRKNSCEKFIYYLHEYPYGRLISYILSAQDFTESVGMQHGPSSKRKLVYYLAKNEVSDTNKSYLNHVPIPESILVEDEYSSLIYSYSNYKNIIIMPQVTRLSYLDKIKKTKPKYILICPGLHDGSLVIDHVNDEIISNKEQLYIIKPHPRASRRYLSHYDYLNLEIDDRHISLLLGAAKEVIVTYSSVGMEASYLELPVRLINIPGKISESPLSDG